MSLISVVKMVWKRVENNEEIKDYRCLKVHETKSFGGAD